MAVAALPWLSVKYAPVALTLGAVFAVVNRRRAPRLVGAVLGALTAGALAYAVTSRGLYGGWTPYAAGSHFIDGEATVMGRSPDFAGRSWRLVALLVDRGFGLAVWQPAWLCAVPAVAWLLARRDSSPSDRSGNASAGPESPRPAALVLVAPLAVGWLVATYLALTMHGWWFPGRQVVVVLPARRAGHPGLVGRLAPAGGGWWWSAGWPASWPRRSSSWRAGHTA